VSRKGHTGTIFLILVFKVLGGSLKFHLRDFSIIRVLISPLPPTYTRHTSRVLILYLSVLPVALVGMGISTLAVVVTVAMTSYILIGIDEIGLEIEHPIPLMPLYGLSKSIHREVERCVKTNIFLLVLLFLFQFGKLICIHLCIHGL